MADTPLSGSQVVDALSQVDVATLGNAAVVAVAQAYLAASQANCVLFANMVHAQQQTAMASHVSTVEAVNKTLNVSKSAAAADDGVSAARGSGGGGGTDMQEIARMFAGSGSQSLAVT
jgi:hypothetical protein